jgi:translation initiation factor IF-1
MAENKNFSFSFMNQFKKSFPSQSERGQQFPSYQNQNLKVGKPERFQEPGRVSDSEKTEESTLLMRGTEPVPGPRPVSVPNPEAFGVGTSQNKQKKQKKLVDMEGCVTHNLSNGKFRLKLENGVEVIGHLSGKIRQNRIKIVVGDKVTVELSPYDLTKGRITYRHR